jgi:alpha-L-fucosidase 2
MNTTASRNQDLAQRLHRLHARYPDRGIVSESPAEKWDFGTVVGNGTQGALAFCRTRYEELVLSHEQMFLPLFPFAGYLPVKPHYETIRQLVIDGKTDQAQQLVRQLKLEGSFPHYNTTDPFVGSCSLDLRMADGSRPADYIRSIDFATGEATVAWRDATGLFHRQFFVSRADDALILRLCSPTGDRLNLTLGLREIDYQPPTDPSDHDIYAKTIDRCGGRVTVTRMIHEMHFKHRWESQPVFGCCTVGRVVLTGGSADVDQTQLCIRDADELLLLIRTVPFGNGEPVDIDAVGDALDGIAPDYDALLAAHAEIHGEMFHRCRLQLSTPEQQQRSGEQMQADSDIGQTDPALVEKTFDASRYTIIASTGKLPPALQGVWTGTWKPRWSGDYTLNGNVQSMVAASLCANHYECQESVMDYLDSLMDDFRENARELIGFRGPLIPWRSSTHGRTHYLAYRQYHHNFPGIFWFPGAAWFAQIYYDYYLHTGDEQFFVERLKPFLLDAVAFYEDFLTYEQDGVYVIAPDSSAENEDGDDIWMAPNPTMTIAAIKQLLRTLDRHADQLGVSESQVAKWREMLSKMPAYAIGPNGALKEWTWPGIEADETHRHASHLYPLWFGVDPDIAASDELRDACRLAIEARIAPRRPDRGGFMAFGYTQFGMAAAHLEDRAHAYEAVEYLVNSFWSPIMVPQHNHDPDGPDVMNVDIAGGLPAVIITMLVQSLMPEQRDQPWIIKLLPCLPDDWPTGSLTGIRCRGGFEVDIAWQGGTLTHLTITSLRGEPVELQLGDHRKALNIPTGGKQTLTADAWS